MVWVKIEILFNKVLLDSIFFLNLSNMTVILRVVYYWVILRNITGNVSDGNITYSSLSTVYVVRHYPSRLQLVFLAVT